MRGVEGEVRAELGGGGRGGGWVRGLGGLEREYGGPRDGRRVRGGGAGEEDVGKGLRGAGGRGVGGLGGVGGEVWEGPGGGEA